MMYLKDIENMNIISSSDFSYYKIISGEKIINVKFCCICGNYISSTNFLIDEIKCQCKLSEILFDEYKQSIERWVEYYEDDFDDSFEHMSQCHLALQRYMINIAFFSMSYKRGYYDKIDDCLIDNIIDFCI